MTNEVTQQPQRSTFALWAITASFVVPALLAYLYFYYGDRPSVKSNGNLIIPIVDIHTLNITDKSGASLSEEKLTPNWRMYYFAGSSCDKDCQFSLFRMRQLNIMMGKYQDRVSHGIIHLAEPDKEFAEFIDKEHQAADKTFTKPENITAISALEKDANNLQSIYLVDPLGNIMMQFPKDLDPKLIHKDINKLLKVSRLR